MAVSVDIEKRVGDFHLRVRFESNSRRIGVLGASGCGKSMTLKCIAGIEKPDAGKIVVDENILFDKSKKINLRPQNRNIGYLFQNYALFPTMTVEQNISAGLKGTKEVNKRRVQEMVKKFQIQGLEKRLPGELSGGQQQRVALARIMAYEPDVILLDEPFSALDDFLKNRLQQELQEMLKDYEGTVIMVSHSRDEIYRFSEELLIMDQGENIEYGRTTDVFTNPEKREAARLTGCKNFAGLRLLSDHEAEIPDWGVKLKTKRKIPEHARYFGYRAHDFEPVWAPESLTNIMKVNVESIAELPFERQFYMQPSKPGTESELESGKASKQEPQLEPGKETKLEPKLEPVCWFVQREELGLLGEKGIPEYLRLSEEKMLFLQ